MTLVTDLKLAAIHDFFRIDVLSKGDILTKLTKNVVIIPSSLWSRC